MHTLGGGPKKPSLNGSVLPLVQVPRAVWLGVLPTEELLSGDACTPPILLPLPAFVELALLCGMFASSNDQEHKSGATVFLHMQ
jgi:hypothetical protein